jgi:hypothetical protein
MTASSECRTATMLVPARIAPSSRVGRHPLADLGARRARPRPTRRPHVLDDGPVSAGAASQQPFDWGDQRRVRELLGDGFELEVEEHSSTLRVPSGEAYWELFSTSYGPTKTLADSLGERR